MEHSFEGIPTVPPHKDLVRRSEAGQLGARRLLAGMPRLPAPAYTSPVCFEHPRLLQDSQPPAPHQDHMAFFCGACRYRVTAYPDWTVEKVRRRLMARGGGIRRGRRAAATRRAVNSTRHVSCLHVLLNPPRPPRRRPCANPQVKRALFEGGIARANKPPGQAATPGIRSWEDLVRMCVRCGGRLRV